MVKNMMRLFMPVMIVLLTSFCAFAQTDVPPIEDVPIVADAPEPPPVDPATVGDIEGLVEIKGKRESVSYATVMLEGTSIFTQTDEDGKFTLKNVPPGAYKLQVTEDTIKDFKKTVTVKAGQTVKAKCYVIREALLLEEVVVSEKKEPEQIARQEISKEELTGVPGANNDAIRVVENMPGVAFTGGFSDGLVIRGTSSEDSIYNLNSFNIPMLFHFGSLISVVNSELIKDIVYYPGGYGVKYGNALGGVVELKTRRPRQDRFGGVVDLATYSSFVLFEGPIGDKLSYAGAVRRSFIDFILPEVIPEDQAQFTLAPRFYDYTGIFDYEPNYKNLIHFMVFGTDDRMGLVAEQERDDDPFMGNSFDATMLFHRFDVQWDFYPNAKILNTLAAEFLYTDFSFEVGDNLWVKSHQYNVFLRDDFSIKLGSWNDLRFGIEAQYMDIAFDLDVIRPPKEGEAGFPDMSQDDTYRLEDSDSTFVGAAYIDDVMDVTSWFNIVPGVRIDYLEYNNSLTADPRASMRFATNKSSAIKTSVGMYHQMPSADELVEPFGTKEIESEVAYSYGLGFEYDFGQGYGIDVQGFYKQLDNMISPTETGADVPYDNEGVGNIYGGELLARKKLTDRLFGWVSYTYSESKRRDRPDSDWRYFDQDQRHNFIVVASYQLGANKQWRIGGRWQLSSGMPYTDIDGAIYNADTDSYIPMYSEDINGKREKLFHQLDIRVDKLWIFNRWTLNTYLDVQNVYWQQYPYGYTYNFDYSERKPVSFPTFMPSIGVQARF